MDPVSKIKEGATADSQRRSTRIRWETPVTLTSVDPAQTFSVQAQTLVVNPQGCGVRSPREIAAGTAVRLQGLPEGGSVSASVVNCISLGTEEKLWLLGLALDEPGNVWGVQAPPEDWGTSPAPAPVTVPDADPHKKDNWPFSQFSRRGEFHPGRR